MSRFRRVRLTSLGGAAACGVLALLAGCGGAEKTVEPLFANVDKARAAQAVSSLQQALTAAEIVRAESGGRFDGSPEELAQRLQARDPSKRFGVAPSSTPGVVQVAGGNGGALMLVVGSTRAAYAAWTDGSTTLYYGGAQAPVYTPQPPAGPGWSTSPPQA